ncbi:hypothetical protein DdX_14182 [Ditylenchus destructor]|uniref:Uncharacterized protein n=1 Tax=Ditylenchus destructor TaxID=166010 RepID=A0AAD4MUZ6_9BILA|nr:hypothetical protein DdX_14182 [Ditylenchus destructor]
MSGSINNRPKEILDFSVHKIGIGIEKYAGNRHEKTGKRKKLGSSWLVFLERWLQSSDFVSYLTGALHSADDK